MNLFNKARALPPAELKYLAGLCAGASLLMVAGLALSGALDFVPEAYKVAMRYAGLQPASVVYADGSAIYDGAATSYTWVAPPDVTQVNIQVVGGGGGGGPGWGNNPYHSCDAWYGQGGAAGQVINQTVSVTPNASYSVYVANVAPGGQFVNYLACHNGSTSGTTGQSSWFGSYVASGGTGGYYNSAFITPQPGVTNGTGWGSGGRGGGHSENGAVGQQGYVAITVAGRAPFATLTPASQMILLGNPVTLTWWVSSMISGGTCRVTGPGGYDSGSLYAGGSTYNPVGGSVTFTPTGSPGGSSVYTVNCTGATAGTATVDFSVATLSLQACDAGSTSAGCSSAKTISISDNAEIKWSVSGVQAGSCSVFKGSVLGDIGTDSAGGTNNFNTNLSLADQVLDAPTNNFATLNVVGSPVSTISEAGLRQTGVTSWRANQGTLAVSSGKWYFETTVVSMASSESPHIVVGVKGVNESAATNLGSTPHGYGKVWAYDAGYTAYGYDPSYNYKVAGNVNTTVSDGIPHTETGHVIMVALDLDNHKIWFGKNGVWSEGNPSAGTSPSYSNLPVDSYVGAASTYYNDISTRINFGQGGQTGLTYSDTAKGWFKYAPPTGFKAWSTANLGPVVIDRPKDYFDAVTYTGTATKRIFLTDTAAATWTVPSDWNDADNTIEAIGGGGGGASSINGYGTGGGGGGGAYAKKSNVDLTPSASLALHVGAGGGVGGAGTDSYIGAASCSGSLVCAKAGAGAVATGGSAAGGAASPSSVGDLTYAGGSGIQSGPGWAGGQGGGGAAGPSGAGGNGGSSAVACGGQGETAGAGGGAANGGTAGLAGSNGTGGNGGTIAGGSGGSGGGPAGINGYNGGHGFNGQGGGGGGANCANGAGGFAGNGGDGGAGSNWDATHGAGAGGGGGAGFNGTGTGGMGGLGGLYGGGGGGGGYTTNGSASGRSGAQGLIVVTYTPVGAKSKTITGLGFQPDLVWIKNRSANYWHTIADSARGALKTLFANDTSAQTTSDSNGFLSAFTSDGFTVTGGSGTAGNVNADGNNYVAWAWDEGATQGVDVVTYSGDGTANRAVAHALGAAPDMVLVKRTDSTSNWYVWHKGMTVPYAYAFLNTTVAQQTPTVVADSPWGNTTTLIPLMTGPTTSGVTMSDSGHYTNSDGWYAADRAGGYFTGSPGGAATVPAWIQVDFGAGNAKVATAYAIKAPSLWQRAPKAWQLQGSNDAGTWVTLDTQSYQLGGDERKVMGFANTTAYRYWRLYITAYGAPPDWMAVDEFELFATPHTASSLYVNAGTNSINASGGTYVAYAFKGVDGFSQFGTYSGNGSTDGPFVYTGFKPRWVYIKRADAADGSGSNIFDSARSPYNPVSDWLHANLNGTGGSGTAVVDFLSNGYKVRYNNADVNVNGGQYIYAAFAEQPYIHAVGGDPALGQSGRFSASNNDYMSRTLLLGNRNKWTLSLWFKRSTLGPAGQTLWSADTSSDDRIYFNSADQLLVSIGGTTRWGSTGSFRDPGAWQQLVVSYDAANATAAQRLRVYINGTEVETNNDQRSSISSNIAKTSTAVVHNIGRRGAGSNEYFDGYITDLYFIDGAALLPTCFGVADARGFWGPTQYSTAECGPYGTNGFHLDFSVPPPIAENFPTPSSGNQTVGPFTSYKTTYTLQCTPTDMASQKVTATISVNPQLNLTAASLGSATPTNGPSISSLVPAVRLAGQSPSLTWSAQYVDVGSCSVTPSFAGSVADSGTGVSAGAITASTTYALSCTAAQLTPAATSTLLRVGVVPATCEDKTSGFNNWSCAFGANSTNIFSGSKPTLYWYCPANFGGNTGYGDTSSTGSGGTGGSAFSTGGALTGSQALVASPANGTQYTLTCNPTASARTITVGTIADAQIHIYASQARVRPGQTTTITWDDLDQSDNHTLASLPADACRVTDPAGAQVGSGTNGSLTSAAVNAPSRYTVTCDDGTGGTISASTVVNVLPTLREI